MHTAPLTTNRSHSVKARWGVFKKLGLIARESIRPLPYCSSLSLSGVGGREHARNTYTHMGNMHSVVHVIFDATRKYGNRGLAVGTTREKVRERLTYTISTQKQILIRELASNLVPLVALDYASLGFFEMEKDLIDRND